MGLSIADARALSWWEYQALVWQHMPEDQQEDAEAPSADFVRRRQEHLAALGIVGSLH
jgi:hypothetical protein